MLPTMFRSIKSEGRILAVCGYWPQALNEAFAKAGYRGVINANLVKNNLIQLIFLHILNVR